MLYTTEAQTLKWKLNVARQTNFLYKKNAKTFQRCLIKSRGVSEHSKEQWTL